MKNSKLSKFAITAIIIMIFAALTVAALGEASGRIYINDSASILSVALSEAYAVGGSGSVEVIAQSSAYAMTARGLETVSDSATSTPDPNAPQVEVGLLNIGLIYGANVVPTANLENAVGSGYIFGFYDAERRYYEVGSTSEKQITMVKDTNVDVTAGTIGCYHIRLSGTYADFPAAQTAAQKYSDGFPAYYNGAYYALVGAYTTYTEAGAAMSSRGISGEIYSASNRCITVTKTNTMKILFEFDYGTTFFLSVRPVSYSGQAVTWLAGYKYYGDFQFARHGGTDMTVSNFVNIEDYVRGVVPYEMSASWPAEALKAQALTARTYAVTHLTSHRNQGFDLCNSADCQVYRGTNLATANSDAACAATSGQYISYNGKLCETFYFSSDGGATEDSENIFLVALPYLRGVYDPYEEQCDVNFGYKSWYYELTKEEITRRLQNKGYVIDTIDTITPEYTRMGNMYKLTFKDINGKSVTVTKTTCYSVLSLHSVRFTIELSESNPNLYIIEGGGWGHNVGMSQWGAYTMAKLFGMTSEEIVKFYYTGVTIG